MIHVGLSYHGGGPEYDAYEHALRRVAAQSGIEAEISWLAGRGRPFLTHRLLGLHGLCLTGGEDAGTVPERDAIEEALLTHAARKSLPLLAICRGAQILNAFNGGTLYPDLGTRNAVHRVGADPHLVRIERGTRLAQISGPGPIPVNTSHHQAVDRLAAGFRVCAVAPDGVIEAFEPLAVQDTAWTLAVQWHPELPSPAAEAGEVILAAFLEAASTFHVEQPALRST